MNTGTRDSGAALAGVTPHKERGGTRDKTYSATCTPSAVNPPSGKSSNELDRVLDADLPPYQPAPAQSVRFLTALFADYQDGLVELRGLPRNEAATDRVRRAWFPLNTRSGLLACGRTAAQWSMDRNVSIGVLPRFRRGGTAADVSVARWLWADIDGGKNGPETALRLLKEAGLPKPGILIATGGGYHAYWKLAEQVALPDESSRRRFSDLLKRLALRIGRTPSGAHADEAVANVPHPLRVPGTFSHKRQICVELLRCRPDEDLHPFVWWRATLPALPAPPEPRRRSSGQVLPLPPTSQALLAAPTPMGSRHKALTRLMASARHCGYGLDALVMLAESFASLNGIPATEAAAAARWAAGRAA